MNTSFATPVRSLQTRTAKLPHTVAPQRMRGFTLVEVVIVLAISCLLLGVAVPQFRSLLRSARLTSATNDMFAGLLLARSEAVKRNARVVLCKSADGSTCMSAGGWEQGWIVFHDTNNNGLREPAEEILQRGQALSADVTVTGNQNVSRYVSYAPSGSTKLVGGGFQAGTITFCEHLATGEARQIILNAVGRPRVQKAAGSVCV
jgi:type IV fimbrial biogenesis protein FimT